MTTKLHAADFYGWALEQAELAQRRSANAFDWDNVAEELRLLGASEERELASRYRVLLTHLLKWIYQPEERSRSWRVTIRNQRADITKHLDRNPGLRSIEAQEFLDAYDRSRYEAHDETGLPEDTFPETPPFTMDEAKSEAFWPA
jgi:hypothetical protein